MYSVIGTNTKTTLKLIDLYFFYQNVPNLSRDEYTFFCTELKNAIGIIPL